MPRSTKALGYGDTDPADLATLNELDAELSKISPDAPNAATEIQDLYNRFHASTPAWRVFVAGSHVASYDHSTR